MMAAAPIVFFIMREDPTTVPATDCTTEPAPGIIPTIRLKTVFLAASKEGDHHRLQQMKPEKHYEQKLQTF